MTTRAAVLAANREFYRAFRERDVPAMDRVWASEHLVACVHPGWEPIAGRAAVLRSWHAILGAATSPPVHPENEAVLSGEGDTAVVVCDEVIDDVRLVATNVFAREGGEWRIVHHHASPLSRLRPAVPPSTLN